MLKAKKEIVVGTVKYLKSLGISFKEEWVKFKEEQNQSGKMASFLAINKKVAGAIVFGDEIRTEIKEIIDIGRQVLKVAKSGILFGMGDSFIAMIFAGLGFIAPVYGAILQEVIDIVVIFNGLRTVR